jgi:hypothetical protein
LIDWGSKFAPPERLFITEYRLLIMVKKHRKILFVLAILVFILIAAFFIYQHRPEKVDYKPLIGQWVRPDGGYVLDIKSVSQGGKIEMAYLNPQPINVSKAQASTEANKVNLFIELRDRLYPGNYYTLTFDSESKRLIGVYHHLGLNQNLDVYFIKR